MERNEKSHEQESTKSREIFFTTPCMLLFHIYFADAGVVKVIFENYHVQLLQLHKITEMNSPIFFAVAGSWVTGFKRFPSSRKMTE